MRRSKLNEGMWSGDLADLVQPLVSIDEYKSKIDVTAIAIGFYVTDKDAAEDLNRFIQKSPVSIIDTDVSPAPDQRGYYLVFVEVENNDRLVSSISSILEEVGPLASVENWQMKVRNQTGLMPYNQEKLGGFLKVNKIKDEVAALQMQLLDFRKSRKEAEQAKKKQALQKKKAAEDAKQKREEASRKRVEDAAKDKKDAKPKEAKSPEGKPKTNPLLPKAPDKTKA